MRSITRRSVVRRLGAAVGSTFLAARAGAAGIVTPSQTAGPFYPVHDPVDLDADLTVVDGVDGRAEGKVILVEGRVVDVEGRAVANALVDVWQANHHGRYRHPRDRNPAPLDPCFQGWAKLETGADGGYAFKTIVPAPYPLDALRQSGMRCRHIHFKVTHPSRRALTTQMYFEGDPLIADDVVMAGTPVELRDRLIAGATPDPATGLPRYRFDVVIDDR